MHALRSVTSVRLRTDSSIPEASDREARSVCCISTSTEMQFLALTRIERLWVRSCPHARSAQELANQCFLSQFYALVFRQCVGEVGVDAVRRGCGSYQDSSPRKLTDVAPVGRTGQEHRDWIPFLWDRGMCQFRRFGRFRSCARVDKAKGLEQRFQAAKLLGVWQQARKRNETQQKVEAAGSEVLHELPLELAQGFRE